MLVLKEPRSPKKVDTSPKFILWACNTYYVIGILSLRIFPWLLQESQQLQALQELIQNTQEEHLTPGLRIPLEIGRQL